MARPPPALAAPWRADGPSLLVREDSFAKQISSVKVAGFDLNDTLVTSRVGAPGYQVTVSDWQFYSAKVLETLQRLHGDGFKLVVFTNQGNIRSALDGKRAQALRAYIDAFCAALGVPIVVLAATQKDNFRKPCRGMWDHFLAKCNAGATDVDMSSSFYVGDAAGEEGDHSADDLDYAKCIGLRFIHVRDFFGAPGSAATAASSGTTPSASGSGSAQPSTAAAGVAAAPQKRGILAQLTSSSSTAKDSSSQPSKKARPLSLADTVVVEAAGGLGRRPVVLVLVGAPGCGKTTFAAKLGPPAIRVGGRKPQSEPEGYTTARWRRVCQDLLGNKEACIRSAEHYLDLGLSVVIDRTNVDPDQRSTWCDLAVRKKASLHCIAFDVDAKECGRRVAERTGHEGGLSGPKGYMVVQSLHSKLQAVTPAEGFERIQIIRSQSDFDKQVLYYSDADGTTGSSTKQRDVSPDQRPAAAPEVIPDTPPERSPPDQSAEASKQAATVTLASAPEPTAGATSMSPEVESLIALGFSMEASQNALKAAGGDANIAANQLLGDRLFGED